MGSVYNSYVDYWRTEDGLTLLAAWKRDGFTDKQIAEKIGVKGQTLCKWKETYPEINEALHRGKEIVDYMVENALLKAALGYKTKEIKVTLGKKVVSGETYQVMKETVVKEVGPNAVACLAWLNNRKFDKWKRNRDNVVETNPDDGNVTVTIIRGKGKNDGLGEEVNDGVKIETGVQNRKPKKVLPDGTVEGDVEDLDAWPDDFEE